MVINCTNSSWEERTFVLANQCSYVLLPVNLSQPGFEDPGIDTFDTNTNVLTPGDLLLSLY